MKGNSKFRGTNTEFYILIFFLVLEILWRLQGSVLLDAIFENYENLPYTWILRGIYFAIIGWFGVKRLSAKPIDIAVVGIYRGAILGIVIGFFELIWYHNVNAFIFLLALPWQTMFAGFIVSGMTAYIVSLWKQERKDYLKK